jgi:hypothetical protein
MTSNVKLRNLERKLGLVPKEFPPMSPGMERIARQQDRQAPASAPVDSSGLGAAIDTLIQQRVDQALATERERHAAEIQQLMVQINKQQARPLPPPKKPREFTSKITRRDHLGRIWITETVVEGENIKLVTETMRDELGSIVSSRTFPWPANETYRPGKPGRLPQAEARQYRPGEPR